MPEITWAPTEQSIRATNLWSLRNHVIEHYGVTLDDYPAFWSWSVTEPASFWAAVTEHAGLIGDGLTGPALIENRLPGAVWYPNARLNYAENVLRWSAIQGDEIAVVGLEEDGSRLEWTWTDLVERTAALAAALRDHSVGVGDVVGGIFPNGPQAIVALLATAAVGAIFSVCSPDFAASAIVDRLTDLAPNVLLASSGYTFKGKSINSRPLVEAVRADLPGRPALEWVDGNLDLFPPAEPAYVRVAFNHPLWVLFSSGTTGAPKGIVHGHGGILLESAKGIGLQFDLGPGDRYFAAANTSWMVWNTLANTLSTGASIVTFPGASAWPDADRQFAIVAETDTTMLATGAAYLALVEKSELRPADRYNLSSLHTIMSTGSVLSPGTWKWVHDAVKHDVHLTSDSGGTDICSGFIGGNPWQSVHLGELQGPTLGSPVEIRTDGRPAQQDEVGELVLTGPMPSMPVRFWNDADGEKYRHAYFEADPRVWTHGDWISRTANNGIVIHGRSDATLNRDGVRLGSADIYAALQGIAEVRNAVILGIEIPGGKYWMPLFVELVEGVTLTDELADHIRQVIRGRTSARHVPDAIEAAPGIPITHAGKRIEVPLKKLFLGAPAERAVNRSSLQNPEAIDWFVARATSFRANEGML
ncbi:MAG: acetoacetate--CoA ligase [Acidobacteria bacterium]|nr:acetoacetate--CoA ligase [Acidobacteriota bacterium]